MTRLNSVPPDGTEERAVGLRTRADLVVRQSRYQGDPCWIVKDPLRLKYYRLRAAEYLVLETLRRPVTLGAIKQALQQSFPDRTTRVSTITRLVHSLHQSELLVSHAAGQSTPLRRRRESMRRRRRLGMLSNPLSIRFPGWDPDRMLTWLYPKVAFLLRPSMTLCFLVIMLAALGLVAVQSTAVIRRLPEFEQFFSANNLLLMGALLVGTKSVHELGHGILCKHFGGECHEIGVMLLVMTPAMYCDTSDSWVLPNRWHRIAIGAAGMYVEMVLAAACTFVWWFTNPGWIHYLALNLMFLSSVTTLIFNANPLLRYDGYYILSDFLEIPNLAEKSKRVLVNSLRSCLLGIKSTVGADAVPGNSVTLHLYGVASLFYRWFILVAICWFILEVMKPLGLSSLGHVLVASCLFGVTVAPLGKAVRYLAFPGRFRQVRGHRLATSLIGLGLVLFAILAVPLPHHVPAAFVIRPHARSRLVAPQAGTLVAIEATAGQAVLAGQVIARLESSELQLQLEQLRGQLAQKKWELVEHQAGSGQRRDGISQIAETEVRIRAIERQIQLQRQQIERLTIRARDDGFLYPPANTPDALAASGDGNSASNGGLGSWTEVPLRPKNIGVSLAANTPLGTVASANQMEAILWVEQHQIQLLRPGQEIHLSFNAFPDVILQSQVAHVSTNQATTVPRELSQTNGGPLAIKPTGSDRESPMITAYEARAVIERTPLGERHVRLVPGLTGRAKVRVGNTTLYRRLVRLLNSTINIR